ncbi:MAG TPA: hypothetical protein PKI03_30730, partial [Pseudomonadota bacterium]|nr:hypothetical protein [Pseudomonadota bacterium]
MKLTPFAKAFITLVILGVVGFVLYSKREQVKTWASGGAATTSTPGGDSPGTADKPGGAPAGVSKDDFAAIGAPREAGRQGVAGISKAQVGAGKLGRKLVVGINTWAGHAPGIVANLGLAGGDKGSIYVSKYGLEVEFK